MKTRVLALNAYHGGSRRAFLDGWMQHSRHAIQPLTLPAYEWKWRKRTGSVWPGGLEPTTWSKRYAWSVVAAGMDDAIDRVQERFTQPSHGAFGGLHW